MLYLLAGLILFLVPHSLPVFARQWRDEKKTSMGAKAYEGVYSIVSLAGLVLIVIGYGLTREHPVFVWQAPAFMQHLTILLTLIAFIMVAGAYVPNNHIKAALGHPMVLGVKVWALAHLLSNGRLGDIVLFGVFLVWSIVYFASARRYDRQQSPAETADATVKYTVLSVIAGLLLWIVFALFLHSRLIGVAPF